MSLRHIFHGKAELLGLLSGCRTDDGNGRRGAAFGQVTSELGAAGHQGGYGKGASEDHPIELLPLEQRRVDGSEVFRRSERNQGKQNGDGAASFEFLVKF